MRVFATLMFIILIVFFPTWCKLCIIPQKDKCWYYIFVQCASVIRIPPTLLHIILLHAGFDARFCLQYLLRHFLSVNICILQNVLQKNTFCSVKDRNTPMNVSPVEVCPVERLLVLNIQTSKNVRDSQYNVFRPMFIEEKFKLTFQKFSTTILTNHCAWKLYVLPHAKQLFVNHHINWLGKRKRCFKHFTS
jgi:hypothetical protein